MLTGRRAFSGESGFDTIAAVLDREPDLAALPESAPPSLRRLLVRCLAKDPRQRLQDVADARFDLEEALTEDRCARTSVQTSSAWRRRGFLAAAAVALPLLLAGAGCFLVGAT